MNGQPIGLQQDRPSVLDQLQHSALVVALTALVDQLKRRIPEPDTTIDWEDGEIDEERDAR